MSISKRERLKLISKYLAFKGEKSVDQIQAHIVSKIIGPYNTDNLKRSIYRDIDTLEKMGELTKHFYDIKTGEYIENPDLKKKYIMKCHSVTQSSFIVGEDLLKDLGINFIPSFNKPEAWKISIVNDKKQPINDSFCFVFKFKEEYICIEAETSIAPLSLIIAGKPSQEIDSEYLVSKFGESASLLEIPIETLVPIDSESSGHTIIHFNQPTQRGEEFVRVNYAHKLSRISNSSHTNSSIHQYLKEDLKVGWVSWSRANDFIEDANFNGILTHFQSDEGLSWIEAKKIATNKGDISQLVATPRPKAKTTAKKVVGKIYNLKPSRLTLTDTIYRLRPPMGIAEYLPLRVMSGGIEFIVFVAYKNPKELVLKKVA